MKYPARQLEVLQSAINELAKHFPNLPDWYESNIHAMVHTQSSEGHTHNWLYVSEVEGKITRAHKIEDFTGWKKLFEVPSGFKLYPDGCNDSHVDTAVRYCLKNITR